MLVDPRMRYGAHLFWPKGRLLWLWLGMVAWLVCMAGGAAAQGRGEPLVGEPIDRGYVVIDGRFIARPYRVGLEGDVVTINGLRVGTLSNYSGFQGDWGRWRPDGGIARDEPEGQTGRSREGGQGRESRENRRDRAEQGEPRRRDALPEHPGVSESAWRTGSSTPERIERRLNEEMVLIIAADKGMAAFGIHALPSYLKIVSGDGEISEKIEQLGAITDRPLHSAVWRIIIDQYRPDPELSAVAAEVEKEIEQRRVAREAEQSLMGHSGFVMHGVTPMAAIAAVLIAVGVLLRTHRVSFGATPEQRGWRHVDTTGQRGRLVLQLAAVLVLLNGLDLIFTLMAQRTGQFIELNAVGERLITNPVALGFYKTTLVAVGVGILLFLRQRRAAELAAWWLCALYVLVLVRWAAVNSLLVA